MKNIIIFLVAMIGFTCLIIPVSSQSDGKNLLTGVKNLSLSVPPTPTGAALGTKEYMYQYQAYLENSSHQLSGYSNKLLNLFGFLDIDWDNQVPSSRSHPDTKAPTKGNMDQYQAWLENSSYQLSGYSNELLNLFGFLDIDWDKQVGNNTHY